eukprot:m.57732 g.57732  ORF g.57732 m.57732 type:complete len:59 (-) comp13743_c0_seq4:1939-2115(-)
MKRCGGPLTSSTSQAANCRQASASPAKFTTVSGDVIVTESLKTFNADMAFQFCHTARQ